MERKWWLVIDGCITHAVNTVFSYFGMSAFFPSLNASSARIGTGWLGDLLDKRRLMMGLSVALSFSVLLMGYTAAALVFAPCIIIYSLAYGGLARLRL